MTRRTLLAVLIVAAAVLVGSPVIWLLGRPADAAGDAAAIEASLTASSGSTTTTSTTLPEPTAPTPTADESESAANWRVPVTQGGDLEVLDGRDGPRPVRLEIGMLRVDAPVEDYGVARNGEMDVPNNTRDVAWYRYGPSPGEPGSAVLAAHVDLGGRKGVFYRLGTLEPGDIVTVVYDDGTSKDFRVEARAEYTKEELPIEAIFSRDGDPVLTLITCGGGFNPSLRSYDSNVVVYAVPVERATPVPAT